MLVSFIFYIGDYMMLVFKIQGSCDGKIEFVGARFTYPTRRNLKVLRSLDLTIKPGQTVALVGTSGCGKSTIVSLVERFYDTNAGRVVRHLLCDYTLTCGEVENICFNGHEFHLRNRFQLS